MSKRKMMACGTMCILVAGLIYFILSWLEVPGLNAQIKRLEAEVNRLGHEVNRLSAQNDRYEALNVQLNITVTDLQVINVELNDTATRLEVVNEELSETNEQFSDRIEDLTLQNQDFKNLNSELNSTVTSLTSEIGRFHSTVGELILENAALADLTESLNNITGSFESIGQNQNSTLEALRVTLSSIVDENSKLEKLNLDLLTIVNFLDETSEGLDDSLQQVTNFLADQITANQVLLLGSLENTYSQRVNSWDCDFRSIFGERDYGQDFNAEIPASDFNEVVTYVSNRVLDELCLDSADFSQYLQQVQFTPLTSNRLSTAVTLYTQIALDWYFPEENESGLTFENWSTAKYDCQNIDQSQEYRFSA
jgi:hypothetical protein